jgi:hypothetical protein
MFWKAEPEARELVATAFKAIVPTTHGIFGDVPQDAKVAWDIQQVIRQDLAIRRNGGLRNPMHVHFDDPMQSSKEPLPKIIGKTDPVAWYHDDFGEIEMSRIPRPGWRPLYPSPDVASGNPSADQDLLEALERLVVERKAGIASLDAWDQARAAIAKAKGGAE